MRCLRGLNQALFMEHRQGEDHNFTLPGELLSIPAVVCPERDDGSGCRCRKTFASLCSPRTSTLAQVCEESEERLHEEFMDSASATGCRRGPEDGALLHRLGCVAAGLCLIPPGAIVRVDRSGPRIRLSDTRLEDILETARLCLQSTGGHGDH